MAFHSLKIGELSPKLPVIQGGMGVGISLSQLAGSVAKEGGIGIISTAQIGFREPGFIKHPLAANLLALKKELVAAREIAPYGIIGVNVMVALSHYEEIVKAAIASGAQLIISGAGLPINLPTFTKDTSVKAIPVISSARAANIICHMWDRKYQVLPDSLIVEGPLAGGHLGFSQEELIKKPGLSTLVKTVKEAIMPYEEKYQKRIPIIAAGGIYNGLDVKKALLNGADGVQMATRFVTTYECDAHPRYKKAYLSCRKKDITLVKSPVGMIGRAIKNELITHPCGNDTCLYHCLKKCEVTTIPYCISKALIAAQSDQLEHGLLFCGSNAYRATKLEHVEAIMSEIAYQLSVIDNQ